MSPQNSHVRLWTYTSVRLYELAAMSYFRVTNGPCMVVIPDNMHGAWACVGSHQSVSGSKLGAGEVTQCHWQWSGKLRTKHVLIVDVQDEIGNFNKNK